MNVLSQTRPPPPLQDLLGVSFVFNSVARSSAWDRDFACFGLADGSIAILRAHWQGAPEIRTRAGGGVEIVAGSAPPPPPAIFPMHKGDVLHLAADPAGGVVTGGADGRVLRLLDGEVITLENRQRRKIGAVAAGRAGRRAFAIGRQVDVMGPEARRLVMPDAVTALAYDPSGLHLAIGYQGGVSLEAAAFRHAPKLQRAVGRSLVWSPNGDMVAACGPAGVAIRRREKNDWEYPEASAEMPAAIAIMADGTLLMIGDGSLFAWRNGTSRRLDNLGPGPLAAPIACHPHKNLFACADRDGRILLGSTQGGPAMLLREPGAAPTLLSFAPDGQALAFAADDGEAGLVILPDLLFRHGDPQ